ncbi:MAG: hypothetical protein ACI89X_002392 [Planctomycetota bacterium]|jgi:hypothetical protein
MFLRAPSFLAFVVIAVCSLQTSEPDVTHGFRDSHFLTSEACAACHIAAPGATAMKDKDGEDISPYYTWQATMMANSFRDPYFRAQLQKESESAGEQVQELCLRCHTPMTHHGALLDGEAPPRLAQAVEDMAADDGVSCTVCHMISAEGLGTQGTFSGRPKFNDERKIFGPFADVETRPMQGQVNYTPTQGDHIRTAGLCATCHTLFTNHHGTAFPEQTPYLEWRNSEFNNEREGADPKKTRTCQQCHMPEQAKVRIARSPNGFDYRIPEREGYRSHAFIGGNAFMLDMLREHRDDLYVEAENDQLRAMAKATRQQLAERTARLSISDSVKKDGVLQFKLSVENLTGHKFPTGYPARRAWLKVEVLVGGKTVFVSGDVNDEGRLVGIKDEMRVPHVRAIEKQSDVVIYEMIANGPDGQPTTYLTKMVGRRKDTRLLPRGFNMLGPHIKDIAPIGIEGDDDFAAGGDRVACRIALPEGAQGECEIVATLHYQSVPPVWVDALRGVKAEEAQRFVGYYDAATKTPEIVATARHTVK